MAGSRPWLVGLPPAVAGFMGSSFRFRRVGPGRPTPIHMPGCGNDMTVVIAWCRASSGAVLGSTCEGPVRCLSCKTGPAARSTLSALAFALSTCLAREQTGHHDAPAPVDLTQLLGPLPQQARYPESGLSRASGAAGDFVARVGGRYCPRLWSAAVNFFTSKRES